jgi:hypothetical protein
MEAARPAEVLDWCALVVTGMSLRVWGCRNADGHTIVRSISSTMYAKREEKAKVTVLPFCARRMKSVRPAQTVPGLRRADVYCQ